MSETADNIPKRRWDEKLDDTYQAPNDTYYLRYWSPKLGREIEMSLKTKDWAKAKKQRKKILENLDEEKDKYAVRYKKFRKLREAFINVKVWESKATELVGVNQLKNYLTWFDNYDPARVNNTLWLQYGKERREKEPTCSLYNARKYLQAILNFGHSEGILKKKIKLDNLDKNREKIAQVLSESTYMTLVNEAPRDERHRIELSYEMAMRIDEIRALRWDRINLKTGEINFGKKHSKNRTERRPVCTPRALEILRERKEIVGDSPWVFPRPTDSTMRMTKSDKEWQKLKARVGVKCRFHDIRHTALTNLFRNSNKYAQICWSAGLDLETAIDNYIEFSFEDMVEISNIRRDFSGKEKK